MNACRIGAKQARFPGAVSEAERVKEVRESASNRKIFSACAQGEIGPSPL